MRVHVLPMLFVCVLLFSCKQKAESQKNPNALNDQVSQIHEKYFVELGGEPQYIEVISESLDNPVLLMVHGGPAWPQTPQTRYLNADLAQDYTLVLWEQRGAGQSYLRNPTPEHMNLEQIIEDGHQATAWAKKKFKKDKIFLMGYSWGSIIGAKMAQQKPEDYHTYIGVAQFISKSRGMEIGHNWLREQVRKADAGEDLIKLDSLARPEFYPNRTERFFQHWLLLNKYRGAVYNQEAEEVVQKAMDHYDDYKGYDWFKAWRESSAFLEDDLHSTDLMALKQIQVPVYLIEGRHDWNVPAVLAKQWLDSLDSPRKKIIWFEKSGHGPLEEEPEKFNQTLADLLKDFEGL